jgi:hypothetical protein
MSSALLVKLNIITLITIYPTEKARIGSSILSLGTTSYKASQSTDCVAFFFLV